jgi:hypothetical protein
MFLTYKVESWPCDIRIPNLPAIANVPGASVLGKIFFNFAKNLLYIIIIQDLVFVLVPFLGALLSKQILGQVVA